MTHMNTLVFARLILPPVSTPPNETLAKSKPGAVIRIYDPKEIRPPWSPCNLIVLQRQNFLLNADIHLPTLPQRMPFGDRLSLFSGLILP